jgi:hypothetical protein
MRGDRIVAALLKLLALKHPKKPTLSELYVDFLQSRNLLGTRVASTSFPRLFIMIYRRTVLFLKDF